MYKFDIRSLELNVDGDPIISLGDITVVVGPNNSGKSKLLREIRDYLCGSGEGHAILKSIELNRPSSYEELNDAYKIDDLLVRDRYGNCRLGLYSNRPSQTFEFGIPLDQYYAHSSASYGGEWKNMLEASIRSADEVTFLSMLEGLFVQYMGTEEKLLICKTQHDYGMDSDQQGFLSSIKFDGELLKNLRKKVNELFHCDIALDDTTLGDQIAFRVSEAGGEVKNAPLKSEMEARELYRTSRLDEQGDGLKSFVSTFLALNMEHGDVLLIDEPESFLHPPLARQLGELIAEASGNGKKIIIATHSVDILKGVLSKEPQARVLRITQNAQWEHNKRNTVKVLATDLLDKILQSPLLRVSRVLEGVFCDRVVLTESEADELVYQELIEKVVPGSGLHFVHGQNKQSLASIVEIYRSIGIRFEMVVDFDVLRKPKEFRKVLVAIDYGMERDIDALVGKAAKLRDQIERAVDVENCDAEEKNSRLKVKRDIVYHREGVSFFDGKTAELIKKTLKELGAKHLHILESGELETLFEGLGLQYPGSDHKADWVPDALDFISEYDAVSNAACLPSRFATQIVKACG